MTLTDLIKRPMQRLNPFRGLVMDVPAWNAAHEYHRRHQQLHALAMHTPGVVTGLEVVGWNPPDNSVLIYPGMAVDQQGNAILLGQPERFYFDTKAPGTAYLVIRLRDIPQEMVQPPGGEQPQPRYLLEGYTLEERRDLPDEPYVELARVQVSGAGVGVTDATNARAPKLDEIDLRSRRRCEPAPFGAVSVGMLAMEREAGGEARHQAGVLELIRVTNETTRYRAEFVGEFSLDSDFSGCDLLIVAAQEGFAVREEQLAGLQTYLAKGGVLFAEACGGGRPTARRVNSPEQSFGRLAEGLKMPLAPVERGHELLTALHSFARPPEGPDGQGLLLSGGGLVYSEADYGCLWNGGRPNAPAGREAIRSSIELGINLGIFSGQYAHRQSIRMKHD